MQRARGTGDAGIVHRDVDAAKKRRRVLHQFDDLIFVAHIDWQKTNSGLALGGESSRVPLARRRVHAADDHISPGERDARGAGKANSGIGADNKRAPSRKRKLIYVQMRPRFSQLTFARLLINAASRPIGGSARAENVCWRN